jgi:8-oxo-dGTP diphosphatase
MATPRVAAGALFFDQDGRVLLVRPSYKPHWDIPGGYVEPDESPIQACVREIREELGLTTVVGQPLVIDWAPNPGEGDKLLFIFDGGVLPTQVRGQVKLDPSELTEFRFFTEEAASELLIPRLSRRIVAAIAARRRGAPVYLENGTAPELSLVNQCP